MEMRFWKRKKKCVCGNVADTKHTLVVTTQDGAQQEYRLCKECVDAIERSGKVKDKDE